MSENINISNEVKNNQDKSETKDDKNKDQDREEIYLYKIIVLGDSSVGKTSFIIRFCDNQFIEENSVSTVGIDTKTKFIKHNGKKIKLEIWDTAGQERFRSITKNSYKGADGILLMFDFLNKKSFSNIKSWMQSIKESIDIKKLGLIIIGNKCDIPEAEREVSKKAIDTLISQYNVKYLETSAKQGINVNETFIELLNIMMGYDDGSKRLKPRKRTKLEKIEDDEDDSQIINKKKNCCK